MMQERLEQLRAELEHGRERLGMLDRKRQDLRDTLLRISGAIQVLEELTCRCDNGEREAASQDAAPKAEPVPMG